MFILDGGRDESEKQSEGNTTGGFWRRATVFIGLSNSSACDYSSHCHCRSGSCFIEKLLILKRNEKRRFLLAIRET